jgi:hypothetical protein
MLRLMPKDYSKLLQPSRIDNSNVAMTTHNQIARISNYATYISLIQDSTDVGLEIK